MFGTKKTSSAWVFYDRIKAEVKRVLDNSLGMDCNPIWIEYKWASGEKERLTAGIRYLNLDDVILMKSRVSEKGKNISREELLCGLENCCIRHEVWTRETGHMWETCSLLERNPDDYDYADTWDTYPIKLTNLSTETIIKELECYVIQKK